MTIFGVAGSVALLFAGLGIQSSVGGVPQRQFGEILKYDMILSTKSSLTDEEEESLKKRLKQADIKETEAIFYKTSGGFLSFRTWKTKHDLNGVL